MTDGEPQDLFRCDHCGQLTKIDLGIIFWTDTDLLSNGDQLYIPAVYCGAYCGRRAVSRAGTGRG